VSALPVFIDGPLKGRTDLPVPASTRMNGMMCQPAPEDVMAPWPEPVLYRFSDVAMFGRTVLIGSVKRQPSGEDVFEALASDQAKASARFTQP
jgi:hypothetical protein